MNYNITDNPWRGLAPYDEYENPNLFCGRKEEIKHLRKLIEDNACVVFYGASGVGKTSLLKAGVMPILRLYNYQPIYIRLSETDSNGTFAQTIVDSLYDFDNDKKNKELEIDQRTQNSSKSWYLWKFFCTTHFFNESREVIPVIILDQFEEVFRGDDRNRTELLLLQIYTLLNGSLTLPQGYDDSKNFRFIISMREDFLFALEDCIDRMGLNRLKNARFRLRPLNIEQAKQVVSVCPNMLPPKEEEREDVIKALIKISIQDGEVSTLLLSLICYRAYELKKGAVIDMEVLKELGEKPLKMFCDEVLKDIDQTAFDYIVKKTIDDNGFRLPVGLKALLNNNVPRYLWDDKNAERIFVKTSRKGIGADSTDIFYELLHDQLALAILDYRKEIEKEIEVRTERKEKKKWQNLSFLYVAEKANRLIMEGDSYFARFLLLEVFPKDFNNSDWPYVPEVEVAIRNSRLFHPNISVAKFSNNKIREFEAVCFSPDGEFIITSAGTRLFVWEVDSGALLRESAENSSVLCSIACDEKYVYTGDQKGFIAIWDAETLQQITSYQIGNYSISSISLHPHKRIIAACSDNIITLLDGNFFEVIIEPMRHDDVVNSIMFSHDGNSIVSSSNDTIIIWETETGTLINKFNNLHEKPINSVSFSPDGSLIATASEDYSVKIVNCETKKTIHTLPHPHPVLSVRFSLDGKSVLTLGENVRLWDVENETCVTYDFGIKKSNTTNSKKIDKILSCVEEQNLGLYVKREFKTFFSHYKGNKLLSISPVGNLFACAINDVIRLCFFPFQLSKSKRIAISNDFPGGFMAFNPINGTEFAIVYNDGWLRTYMIQDYNVITQKRTTYTGHKKYIKKVAYSNDGQNIITSSMDGKIKIWDAELLSFVCELKGKFLNEHHAVFCPQDKHTVLLAEEDQLVLKNWEDEIKLPTKSDGHTGKINSICYEKNGCFIVTSSADHTVKLWDSKTMKCMKTFSGKEGHKTIVNYAAISYDGRKIVSGDSWGYIKLWNVDNATCIFSVSGHNTGIRTLEFDITDNYVISTAFDNTVKIWEISHGCLIESHEIPTGNFICASFCSEKNLIFALSDDGYLYYWPFLCLQTIIAYTREQFKNRKLTPEERSKFYLE